MSNTAQAILDAVGGPGNITHLTHCATRLRFELRDASVIDKDTVESIDGVLGAVPQSGDRYQIVIGGAVQSVYNDIQNLPAMKSAGAASNEDVKAAARAKARGKNAIVDAFFEYLSDSFRPLLPVLLGASLILAFLAVLDALHVVDTRADTIPVWLGYVNSMWRAVFYFLPAMVAYNASKKLDIDPWVGTAVILALLTPDFLKLSDTNAFDATTCTTNALGTNQCVTNVWGVPLQLADYGGQVFVPLLMVPILALLYKGLKKVVPANVQMVFVPFISFVIIMPLTAFLIGPLSIWIGNGLGGGLAWLNGNAPILFAIIIPIIYPFLVPLGLHWPLNALQLANIAATGSDFIQGPMGAWNFACFGATAGVLFLSIRDRDSDMRQTASGALAAGLFGGNLGAVPVRHSPALQTHLPADAHRLCCGRPGHRYRRWRYHPHLRIHVPADNPCVLPHRPVRSWYRGRVLHSVPDGRHLRLPHEGTARRGSRAQGGTEGWRDPRPGCSAGGPGRACPFRSRLLRCSGV